MSQENNEYKTQSLSEYSFLRGRGVYYSSIEQNEDIITYRYTKTARLFSSLSEYYGRMQVENEYRQLKNLFDSPQHEVQVYDNIEDALKAVASLQKTQGAELLE